MKGSLELTHLALWVSDIDASIEFYLKYAGMSVLTQRQEKTGSRVAWISDDTQRLVLVLLEPFRMPLRKRFMIALMRRIRPPAHIGVECTTRDEIQQLCDMARSEGVLRKPPVDRGGSIGFVGFISDPDGNDLELSFGQNTREYL
jgi:catechol 2,3-dioxygenase-like lactoylglutathione lyase family enzyme